MSPYGLATGETSLHVQALWQLARLAEFRDASGGRHVMRVSAYSRLVAEALNEEDSLIERVYIGGALHDVGYLGIPDTIIWKQGVLSNREQEIMRRHCSIGHRLLTEDAGIRVMLTPSNVGRVNVTVNASPNPILLSAAAIAFAHHEKWDGTGYPNGLAGSAIPREAQIVSICDVFDSLTSQRPFREAYTVDAAIEILQSSREKAFAPDVHDAFMEALPHIIPMRESLPDAEESAFLSEESLI